MFWLCLCLWLEGNTEHGLAHRVVTDLCLLKLGPNNHVIHMDNFFTGIPLRQLENASIYSVGTIWNNRFLHSACLKDKTMLKSMKRGEYHTASSGSMVATVWHDTKVVSFVSNVHDSHGTCWKKEKGWYCVQRHLRALFLFRRILCISLFTPFMSQWFSASYHVTIA